MLKKVLLISLLILFIGGCVGTVRLAEDTGKKNTNSTSITKGQLPKVQ